MCFCPEFFAFTVNEYCSKSKDELLSPYLFTWDNMLDAVFKLKPGKATSTFIKAEHVFLGCPELLLYLHLLFNGLLSHSYMPHEFLCGTITPIVKDVNGDTTNSSNYRPITLGPVFLQIFENALLQKFGHYLVTNELQFAYKRAHSTAHASYVLKSCVDYFTENGSSVIGTFLDCSKAFDTISHYGIFLKLMERCVPVCFLKLIVYWYLNMTVRCRWMNGLSDYFSVTTGIKQGGVLSPQIFTLYVDELIICLKNSGIGCYFLNIFIACIMYADDLCLLAPSRGAMQKLLSICEEFSKEFCLSFNCKKSKALFFGKQLVKPSIHLNGEAIEFVDTWKYLGCSINSRPSLSFSIKPNLCSYYASTNSILKCVGKPSEHVLMNLLYSHCVPNLTYCAEVKTLSANDMQKCNVALNDSIRYIFSFNRWESTRFLRQLFNRPNIVEIFHARRKRFSDRNKQSDNSVIRFLATLPV